MSKLKIGLIGAGQRGKDIYGEYGLNNKEDLEFISVVEPNDIKREEFRKNHNIKEEFTFKNWNEFFALEKFCDAVIIATPDDMHYEPTLMALEKGYHILLEKPMSNNPKEVIELGKIAKTKNTVFMICHVLRYTPFYSKLKELLDNKKIGDLITIQHNENIGYLHFAHSFVRGNWRNEKLSSPLILQKSCHDMDILLWLVSKDCKKISSFGHLNHFKKEKKPIDAGFRCIDCNIEMDCEYSAKKIYYNRVGHWPTTVITEIQTNEAVKKAVKDGPYGRCVYECDNDVVDNQSTILEFEDGITVDFKLSAFTNKTFRNIKIMGTKGEIKGSDIENTIEVQIFGSEEKEIIKPRVLEGGHGGGDTGIMLDFINSIKQNNNKSLTSAINSVQSHVMAFAAEESRKKNKVVNIDDFYNEFNILK